ncbi:hypothetical protein BSKO_00967 [Bryopsis sp. KO-2023]|nr:hypothetical protein BSKO_00967 [Bryopsis sp. KO-2023]
MLVSRLGKRYQQLYATADVVRSGVLTGSPLKDVLGLGSWDNAPKPQHGAQFNLPPPYASGVRFASGTVGLDFNESSREFEEKEKVDTPKPPPHPSAHVRHAEEGSKRSADGTYWLMQPVYDKEYLESIRPKHLPPVTMSDKIAYNAVQMARWSFDKITGYGPEMNEKKWLRRMIFLETVAGVPGMVGGMLRHLRSLRTMRRDHGWIHTLLEEAENERMHLLTLLQIREPGFFFRSAVILAQGIFFNAFFISYLISPKVCHRFVGYLEEEAVKTYTHALHDIDSGRLPAWSNKRVPAIAQKYWMMPEDATMRDLVANLRADEACHSHVNHTFSSMQKDDTNPFDKHSHTVP